MSMRINKSWLIAAGIAAVATLWIVSGAFGGGEDEAAPQAPGARAARAEAGLVRVRVQTLTAEEKRKTLSVYGRTRPNRDVTVRAETGGRVEEMPVAKGDRVTQGQLLFRLAMNDRAARRLEAASAVDRRRLEFEQASKLQRSDFASRTRVAEARAALEAARADLAAIEKEIADVTVEAPFDGVFNENLVDVGAVVSTGEALARVIDTTPMVVVASVSERYIDSVTPGVVGAVHLVDGRDLPGTVTWVSAAADPTTRTYAVEMEVANDDLTIPSGMTAEMRLPLKTVKAHRVSPAVLTLNDAGEVGVKVLDAEDRVVFRPVALVADGPDGVWLSGLSETVRLIAVGQEYVRPGEQVEPVPVDAPGGPAVGAAQGGAQSASGDASADAPAEKE